MKICTPIILLILFAVFSQSGCSSTPKHSPRSFLLSNDDFDVASNEYTDANVREDMSVLIQFFKNGYSGYEFIDKSLIQKAESQLISLPNQKITSWSDLCEKIAIIFNELPDGHLQSYYNKNCLPSALSSDRISNIGKNISEGHTQKAYKKMILKRRGQSYGIIGIKRFPAFDDKKWEGFETAIQDLKTTSKIIIDLRRNSGGDDSRGLQLAGLLKGKSVIKSEYAMDYERTNPETYILIINKMTSKARRSSEGAWDRYKRLYEAKLNNPTQEKYISSFDTSSVKAPVKDAPYKKPIYVLVDSECGSSGESTTQALRTLSNVKVVGQNTAGVTHFGNQGLLILPNSRMRISMSTKFIKFNDGTFVEKIGHKPDILIPSGTNALEYVLSNF